MAVKKKKAKVKKNKKQPKKSKSAIKKKPPRTTPTLKESRFIIEFLIDHNGTQAAIRAKYKKSSARTTASDLLAKPYINALVRDAIEKRNKRTEIDADWLHKHLSNKAEADLSDIYTKSGELKPIHEWPKIWRQGLIAGIESKQAYTIDENGKSIPDGVIMKVRIADRTKIDELIGKHVDVQAFKEKIEHSGSVDLTRKTDDELRAIIAGKD